MFLHLIPSVKDQIVIQTLMLLGAILLMGIASAIYIGVDAGAGPRDSLMLAVHRRSGWSIRFGRAVIEILVVTVGFLLGGPLGFGTILFALLIGPAVQWAFKLFKVQTRTHESKVVEASSD
jgi:uncharacterized membrane protein YczE